MRNHKGSNFANVNDLIEDIKKAAHVRNVLCHGSWRAPDASGKSLPYYFNKKGEKVRHAR